MSGTRRSAIAAHVSRDGDDAVFRRARLRLTAWYVAILAVIIVAFSIALYAALAAVLDARQTDGPDVRPQQSVERETSDFALSQLRLLLLAGNAMLLGGAAAGAYVLAGKTLQPVGRALARQRRFAADASHELRTPLTVIRGTLDVALQHDRSPAAYREVLAEVVAEVDVMTDLVEQLLQLARLGAGLTAADARCDVQAVLAEVVRATADLAADHGSHVTIARADSLGARADCQALRQVLLNLVRNALTHTPPGTTVRLAARRQKDSVDVTIADRGPGIPLPERERIFEPFYRGAQSRVEGTGLGLAIARELIDAQRGSISVNETPGGGATFIVRLRAA